MALVVTLGSHHLPLPEAEIRRPRGRRGDGGRVDQRPLPTRP